eukprot:scaffold13925_cov80-Phaeocystis_antarctica.AAC.1
MRAGAPAPGTAAQSREPTRGARWAALRRSASCVHSTQHAHPLHARLLYKEASSSTGRCTWTWHEDTLPVAPCQVVALDLTNDHKPDLPEEKKRILAAGGTVTPAGPDGRPSRMYANGHVGLAMSRSLGDGLCKDYGCIPDPEIQHFSLKLPPKAGPQGEEVDSFLIVASDGVWEFITSQEACEIVSKCESASDAVENLVNEACARWRQFEGSYRDDITAIIVYLPFLDDGNE